MDSTLSEVHDFYDFAGRDNCFHIKWAVVAYQSREGHEGNMKIVGGLP